MEMAFGPGGLSSGAGGNGGPGSGHQRTKRMRTSFKHHQLRTMKSYFHHNHNPDAKDLKQLSQKTGLPKRVLQVNLKINNFTTASDLVSKLVVKRLNGPENGKTFPPQTPLPRMCEYV